MKTCLYCGTQFESGYPFTKKGKEEKFCSLECRKNYKASLNNRSIKRICAICNEEFLVNSSSNRKICNNCKNKREEKSKFFEKPRICKCCGKEFSYDWRKDIHTRKNSFLEYCSLACSNKITSLKSKNLKKELICPVCGKSYITSLNTPKNSKCFSCRKENKKNIIKNNKKTKRKLKSYKYDKGSLLGIFERSRLFIQKSASLSKLGFNFENSLWEEEYLKVQKFLITEYEINLKSANQIEKEYGITQGLLTTRLLKYFNIKKRNASEANSLSIFTNEKRLISDPLYHSGHYKDWEGKDHYLRSSYEFDFARLLDQKKIHYETEILRIRYFDKENNVFKTGIPDFYLPDKNVFVEIKSNYFYNHIDLQYRKEELKRLGFKFYVFLDKEKFLENFLPLKEIKDYMTFDQFLEKLNF